MLKTLRLIPLALSRPAISRLAGSAALILAITACAAAPLPPTRVLQASQTAIDSAEQARVAGYASAELSQAHDKLSSARTAVTLADMENAREIIRRQAEQSQLDSQLTLAGSEVTKARLVNEEALKSTNSLKVEMPRNMGVRP